MVLHKKYFHALLWLCSFVRVMSKYFHFFISFSWYVAILGLSGAKAEEKDCCHLPLAHEPSYKTYLFIISDLIGIYFQKVKKIICCAIEQFGLCNRG